MQSIFCMLLLVTSLVSVLSWSPYYPVRVPRAPRAPLGRLAPPPAHVYQRRPSLPVMYIPEPEQESQTEEAQRPKRDHRDDYHHDFDHDHDHDDKGITGPVHTFVKTDKNANYKWGVRHHVGNKFAS